MTSEILGGTKLSNAMEAGLLLWARTLLVKRQIASPTVAEILRQTGVSPAQAYSRQGHVQQAVASLDRPRGRPPIDDKRDIAIAAEIAHLTVDFLIENPGAVSGSRRRRSYSQCFRQHVLDMRARYPSLSQSAFARAVGVPVSSLRAWQRRSDSGKFCEPDCQPVSNLDYASETTPCEDDQPKASARPIIKVLSAYAGWRGSLAGFCRHVQRDLDIPWKPGVVRSLLAEYGLRSPRPRGRHKAQHREAFPRGSFRTFFPDAQWLADGAAFEVHVDGQTFRFNVELMVDADSGAIAGASLHDRESKYAVIDAFDDAVTNVGQRPLSLILDRRACNRAQEIESYTGDTEIVYAPRGRPQSKGHIEGAFGLFAQSAPEITAFTDNHRELARQLLRLVLQTWARTFNYRPRRLRRGRSRVELHGQRVTSDSERAEARANIHERAKRGRRRRWTRRQTVEPATVKVIAGELARQGIQDANDHLAVVLARYSFEAVLAGIAVYAGKRSANTLPDDADGRYLLGIVTRLDEDREGIHIAEHLWHTRTAAMSSLHAELAMRESDTLCRVADVREQVPLLIDEGLAVACPMERRFWLAATARLIASTKSDRPKALYLRAVRRIHAALDLSHRERLACIRALAAELIPAPSTTSTASL